ncbi:Uncharacterised protein [Citrobacter youngae]|nr:Uncharacterised protein [Citrobacter youngae]
MTIYNGLFEPKKSAVKDCGAVQLAIAIDAPNKKVAESIMTGKLWEAYPANGDNYFKPKLWEHAEGLPLPAVGKFDEQFALAHTFDGEKWIINEPETNVSNLPASNEIIDLAKLPSRERFAAVLMFSDSPIDGVLYSQVLDYLDNLENNDESFDEDDRVNLNILHALHITNPCSICMLKALIISFRPFTQTLKIRHRVKLRFHNLLNAGWKTQVSVMRWCQTKHHHLVPALKMTMSLWRHNVVINTLTRHWIRKLPLLSFPSLQMHQCYQEISAMRKK